MAAQLQLCLNEITPTITASSAYASGNQVGGLQTLANAAWEENHYAQLTTLTVVDGAKQKAALTVYFFDSVPTISSTDKTALTLTAAEAKLRCTGQITIATADYQDTANASIATKAFQVYLKSKFKGNIYAVAMTTGTPTYTGTADLVFKYTTQKIL